MVARGFRPGWPSSSSERPAAELWEHIEACWHQEPNKRPTAFVVLQTLSTLSETQCQGRAVVPAENFNDEALMLDWEDVRADPEESAFSGQS